MSLSSKLGEQKSIRLPQGTIQYRESGRGTPILFVHGVLVNGDLWRDVVPRLAGSHRCITPDLPLGAHTGPREPTAELSTPGLARLVADFMAALDLRDVTLVGNDTGGAICQIVVTKHPERIGRLVLTNCDAYDVFPPSLFKPLFYAGRIPGFAWAIAQPLRMTALRHSPIGFGWLAKHGIPADVTRSWLDPLLADSGVRRDVRKLLKGAGPRHTQEAARRFGEFDKPVLIAWAPEKDFFPVEYGERLARDFPQGRLERIADSWTFIPEDQPQRLAQLIGTFAREPVAA